MDLDHDLLADAGLRCAVADGVLTLTLTRPDRRNAQTPALWRALAEVGAAVPDAVHVIVLRAEGPSFSAGLDRALLAGDGEGSLAQLGARPAADVVETIRTYQEGFSIGR